MQCLSSFRENYTHVTAISHQCLLSLRLECHYWSTELKIKHTGSLLRKNNCASSSFWLASHNIARESQAFASVPWGSCQVTLQPGASGGLRRPLWPDPWWGKHPPPLPPGSLEFSALGTMTQLPLCTRKSQFPFFLFPKELQSCCRMIISKSMENSDSHKKVSKTTQSDACIVREAN